MARLSIASFNVLNFKTDSKSGRNKEFKQEKIRRIGSIIRDNEFDIVALQEIQSEDSVRQIVDFLNQGGSVYKYKHCNSIYEELSGEFQFKSGLHSELGFVWDSRTVELDENLVVYKGIHDRLLRAIDSFVTSATGVISTLLGTGAMALGNVVDSKDEEEKKKRKDEAGLLGGSALLVAGGGSVAHCKLRDEIEGVLRNTLRPPLVGLFRRVGAGASTNTQIRVINVHTQFGKTKYDKIGGVKLRKMEVGFVLGDIFKIVDSQTSGEYITPRTIVAGDFNLSLANVKSVIKDLNAQGELVACQSAETTLTLINRKEVEEEDKPPEYEVANDYDHFVFRSDCWSDKDAAIVRDDDTFFVGKKGSQEYKPISDHYPIEIATEKV